MKKKSVFFIASLLIFSFFISQKTFAYTCPNYMFSKDLSKGMTSQDVRVIQEILNLDSRTLVTPTGPGSRGNETRFFGIATREALKRFQALFIEYIGIANGKFNSKTRTTMNAVCKGPFFTGGSGGVYDMNATSTPSTDSKDKIPPVVAVAGPNSADINTPFRAFVGSNEPIQIPALSGLIISNATVLDLRKVSSTSFSFLVTPNQDAKGQISLQFEADAISDLAGNKNENATNEWVVSLTGTSTVTNAATNTLPFELPTIDLPVVTPTTDCSTVSAVNIADYSNPCYGKAPMSYAGSDSGSGDSGGGGGGQQLQQMLQGLLQGLVGAISKGMQTGGKIGGDAACGCTGLPTAQYSPIGPGLGGRNIIMGIMGGGGDYVGRQSAPPGICGVRPRTGPKDQCAGIPGPHTGACCGILLDVTMQPVTGTLSPSPTGMRSN